MFGNQMRFHPTAEGGGGDLISQESSALRDIAGAGFVPFSPALSVSDLSPEGQTAAITLYTAIYGCLQPQWKLGEDQLSAAGSLLAKFGSEKDRDSFVSEIIAKTPGEIFETAEYKAALRGSHRSTLGLPHADEVVREECRVKLLSLSNIELIKYRTEGTNWYAPDVIRALERFREWGFAKIIQNDVDQIVGRGVGLHFAKGDARETLQFIRAFDLVGPISEEVRSSFPPYVSKLLANDAITTYAELRSWIEFKLAEAGRGEITFTAEGATASSRAKRTGFDREMIPPGRLGLISEGLRVPEHERDMDRGRDRDMDR